MSFNDVYQVNAVPPKETDFLYNRFLPKLTANVDMLRLSTTYTCKMIELH